MNSQETANILIAVLAVIAVGMCWDSDGNSLFQAGLVWAGANVGHLITVYLDKGEEE